MEIGKFKLAKADLVRPPRKPIQEQIIPKEKPYTKEVFQFEVEPFIKGFIGGFPKNEMTMKLQSILDKAVERGALSVDEGTTYMRDRKQQLLDFVKQNPGQTLPELTRENFAIGGGVIQGQDLGTREGFEDPKARNEYQGARGKNRPKGTTINNLFAEDPNLKDNIKKEYAKGSGADRIIRDLNLKGKIGSKSLQDYINEQLEDGKFKPREANKKPDTVKQPGAESRKFMDYIENIIDQNPGKKNMFQNLQASEIIKDSGADISTTNATRIINKIYGLSTKGAKLESFYPNIEKRAIELLDTGMSTADIASTLVKEGLIERQVDKGTNKTNNKPVKNYLQRLIDSGKTKIKKLTIQQGGNVDLETRNVRDEAIKNLLDQQSSPITANRISTVVSEELGETVSPEYVKTFFKRNNIDIDKYINTNAQRIFPEVEALDKIVKKNIKYLTDPNITFVDKGEFLNNEYIKAVGKTKAKATTANEAGVRFKKLLSLYAGGENRYSAALYNKIKPLANYTNPDIQKNLIGLATNLSRASNVDVARMLGLPKKDINLLQDLQKATSELGDFKIAGDHTDIKAIMSDFPNYKKNFMRIQYVSNDLNTFKSYYDKKIIALYNAAKAGASPETIIPKLEQVQNEFKTKTGYDIGGFSFNKNGKIVIDPQTVAVNEYRYPINDTVIKTMGNIEAYENKKYTNPLDKEVMANKGKPNNLQSIYEKYTGNVDVINDSKYVKALDKVPKLKGFKNALLYGGAGTAIIFSTAANADTEDDMFTPVDPGVIVPQETEKESLPYEAALPAGFVLGKYAVPFLKNTVKSVGSPVVSGGLAVSEMMSEDPNMAVAGAELLLPEIYKQVGSKLPKGFIDNVLGLQGLKTLVNKYPMLTKFKPVANLVAKSPRVMTPTGLSMIMAEALRSSEPKMLLGEDMEPKTFEREDASFVMPTMIDMNEQAYKLSKEKGISYEDAFRQLAGDKTFQEGIESLKEKYAIGGRVGFAEGPEDPSKRKFMKIMGGLASLPIVGRFFDVAQVAEKAAPAVIETFKNAPPHFMGLVNKIRALGKIVEPEKLMPSDQKRYSNVYDYGDYRMYEGKDGQIEIAKDKFMATDYGDAKVSEEYMSYNPKSPKIGKKGELTGETEPQYDEYTAYADQDGKMKDVVDGVEPSTIDEGTYSKEELEQLIIEQVEQNLKKGKK